MRVRHGRQDLRIRETYRLKHPMETTRAIFSPPRRPRATRSRARLQRRHAFRRLTRSNRQAALRGNELRQPLDRLRRPQASEHTPWVTHHHQIEPPAGADERIQVPAAHVEVTQPRRRSPSPGNLDVRGIRIYSHDLVAVMGQLKGERAIAAPEIQADGSRSERQQEEPVATGHGWRVCGGIPPGEIDLRVPAGHRGVFLPPA